MPRLPRFVLKTDYPVLEEGLGSPGNLPSLGRRAGTSWEPLIKTDCPVLEEGLGSPGNRLGAPEIL
jgi:hypothetical protein